MKKTFLEDLLIGKNIISIEVVLDTTVRLKLSNGKICSITMKKTDFLIDGIIISSFNAKFKHFRERENYKGSLCKVTSINNGCGYDSDGSDFAKLYISTEGGMVEIKFNGKFIFPQYDSFGINSYIINEELK
jgi:hypothetical protein